MSRAYMRYFNCSTTEEKQNVLMAYQKSKTAVNNMS